MNGVQIVASELKDPICHSNECQIRSFSSEATTDDDVRVGDWACWVVESVFLLSPDYVRLILTKFPLISITKIKTYIFVLTLLWEVTRESKDRINFIIIVSSIFI